MLIKSATAVIPNVANNAWASLRNWKKASLFFEFFLSLIIKKRKIIMWNFEKITEFLLKCGMKSNVGIAHSKSDWISVRKMNKKKENWTERKKLFLTSTLLKKDNNGILARLWNWKRLNLLRREKTNIAELKKTEWIITE